MRFSLAWLRELVPALAAAEPGEVAARLTAAGHAVEGSEEHDGDLVLDVDVTTNRVDAMCHLGLARELAALWRAPLVSPAVPVLIRDQEAPRAVVSIAAPTLCRRYVGLVVRGVRVGASPRWLQQRLLALGLRPINNVVDVTNYVLWERGQPLHAFDLGTLAGGRLVVREAAAGESLRTLDGVDRPLAAGMLVIADASRPVAVAGVMGGEASEVTAATQDVLLESAWFDPATVRRTAKRLGLHTDASHRFERGVDLEGQLAAAERAAALLLEVAAAAAVGVAVDERGEALPSSATVALSARRLARFAGVEIAPAEVERWLTGLGCGLVATGAGEWQVSVPSWRRFDLLEEADLFEEALRLHGFDRVAAALPAVGGPDAPEPPAHRLRRRVRALLAAAGYAETIDWAFYDAGADEVGAGLAAPGPALRLDNPLSERHALMRRSLVPGLCEAASFNRRRGLPAVRLFEVGHVFWRDAAGKPAETDRVAVICGGQLGDPWRRSIELDLFDLKGTLEAVAEALGRPLVAEPGELAGLVPGRAARLRLAAGGEPVGALGQLAEPPDAYPLYVAELELAAFLPPADVTELALPSRFPGIRVDLTFTHPLAISWSELAAEIERRRAPELASFGLENRYQGEGVPAGAVNTTIRFLYQSADRSLTQEEVNERQAALAAVLEERFGLGAPRVSR